MTTAIEKFQQEQRDKSRLPKEITVTLSADQYHRLMPHLRKIEQEAYDNFKMLQAKQDELNLKLAGTSHWFKTWHAIQSLVNQLEKK